MVKQCLHHLGLAYCTTAYLFGAVYHPPVYLTSPAKPRAHPFQLLPLVCFCLCICRLQYHSWDFKLYLERSQLSQVNISSVKITSNVQFGKDRRPSIIISASNTHDNLGSTYNWIFGALWTRWVVSRIRARLGDCQYSQLNLPIRDHNMRSIHDTWWKMKASFTYVSSVSQVAIPLTY